MDDRPQPTPLEYRAVVAPPFHWGRFVSTRIFVCVALLWALNAIATLVIVPRFAAIFADFALKLPWATQILIDVAAAERKHYLWLAILPLAAMVAVLLSMLTWRGDRRESMRPRAWMMRGLILLILLGIAAMILSLFVPIVTLTTGISGSKK